MYSIYIAKQLFPPVSCRRRHSQLKVSRPSHATASQSVLYFASSAIFIVKYASRSNFGSSGSDITMKPLLLAMQ